MLFENESAITRVQPVYVDMILPLNSYGLVIADVKLQNPRTQRGKI